MRYLIQRVVHNDNGWAAPTRGRLQFTGDGDYLEKTGFGHEDWNFSGDICADGYSYAYMYFRPKSANGPFNILFATYDKGEGWALCGYYVGATFSANGPNFPPNIIRRRASELKALDNVSALGAPYHGKSIVQLAKRLKKDAQYYCWRVQPNGIHRLRYPIRLPKSLTSRFGAYFTRPTELDKKEWGRLIAHSKKPAFRVGQDNYSDGGDTEFPEGKTYEVRHKTRERNPKLVAKAKAQFKSKFGRLFCEACDFDFAAKYGNAGDGFIEAHHKIPVSELKPSAKTKIDDLVLVCSNCHRMLHRRRPWQTIQALRRLIKQMEQVGAE